MSGVLLNCHLFFFWDRFFNHTWSLLVSLGCLGSCPRDLLSQSFQCWDDLTFFHGFWGLNSDFNIYTNFNFNITLVLYCLASFSSPVLLRTPVTLDQGPHSSFIRTWLHPHWPYFQSHIWKLESLCFQYIFLEHVIYCKTNFFQSSLKVQEWLDSVSVCFSPSCFGLLQLYLPQWHQSQYITDLRRSLRWTLLSQNVGIFLMSLQSLVLSYTISDLAIDGLLGSFWTSTFPTLLPCYSPSWTAPLPL